MFRVEQTKRSNNPKEKMYARIFQAVLLSCFLFKYVETRSYWIIPPQEIKNYTEIEWRKPPDLHGFYNMILSIFPLKYCPKGKVMLSVDNDVRHATESSTFDNMTQFLIEERIMFKPGENLNIFYEGNISLFIKQSPESYIILIKVNETVPIVEEDITSQITKVAVTKATKEVALTEPTNKMLNLASGIFQTLFIILLVSIILLITVLRRKLKCCNR